MTKTKKSSTVTTEEITLTIFYFENTDHLHYSLNSIRLAIDQLLCTQWSQKLSNQHYCKNVHLAQRNKIQRDISSTFYIPPGLLPAETPLNTPRPGRSALARPPSGGGLIADSGTSSIIIEAENKNHEIAYLRTHQDEMQLSFRHDLTYHERRLSGQIPDRVRKSLYP